MLENILKEGEHIAEYKVRSIPYHCISSGQDIITALNDTLKRILEAGGNELDVFRIMGAKITEVPNIKETSEKIPLINGYFLSEGCPFSSRKDAEMSYHRELLPYLYENHQYNLIDDLFNQYAAEGNLPMMEFFLGSEFSSVRMQKRAAEILKKERL